MIVVVFDVCDCLVIVIVVFLLIISNHMTDVTPGTPPTRRCWCRWLLMDVSFLLLVCLLFSMGRWFIINTLNTITHTTLPLPHSHSNIVISIVIIIMIRYVTINDLCNQYMTTLLGSNKNKNKNRGAKTETTTARGMTGQPDPLKNKTKHPSTYHHHLCK